MDFNEKKPDFQYKSAAQRVAEEAQKVREEKRRELVKSRKEAVQRLEALRRMSEEQRKWELAKYGNPEIQLAELFSIETKLFPSTRKAYRCAVYTKEELEEKRRKAIEEEAKKKAQKMEVERIKNENRWVAIGKAVCDIFPEDFDLDRPPAPETEEGVSGETIVAGVHNFVENFKKLMNDQARGTVFSNCYGLTSSLCQVNQKSVVYMDERIDRKRQHKERAMIKEEWTRKQIEDRWVEVGRAICALTPEDIGMNPTNSEGPSEGNVAALESLFARDSDSEREKSEEPANSLSRRGESIVENVYNFSVGIKELMGFSAKYTCFKSVFEITSILAELAEKSVRDRYPIRRTTKQKRKRVN